MLNRPQSVRKCFTRNKLSGKARFLSATANWPPNLIQLEHCVEQLLARELWVNAVPRFDVGPQRRQHDQINADSVESANRFD